MHMDDVTQKMEVGLYTELQSRKHRRGTKQGTGTVHRLPGSRYENDETGE
jgi:hypothetical protein